MEYNICNIKETDDIKEQAKILLLETFPKTNMWPDISEDTALEAVDKCIADDNICIGMKINGKLIGWVGLRPMYNKTWELHPMAVKPEFPGLDLKYGIRINTSIDYVTDILGNFYNNESEWNNENELGKIVYSQCNVEHEYYYSTQYSRRVNIYFDKNTKDITQIVCGPIIDFK